MAKAFTEEDEEQFLDLKSVIAQEYESVMISLAPEIEKDEKALRILVDAPLLRSVRDSSEGIARRVEAEWHTTFIKLQTALGRLKAKRMQLASVSAVGVITNRVLHNPVVIMFIIVVVGIGVLKVCEEFELFKPRGSLQSETQGIP